MKKLEKFDADYFRVKSYFDGDGNQTYLVLQAVYNYFERAGSEIFSWKPKVFSNGKISFATTTSNNKFATNLIYDNARIKVKFNGDFLRQNKVTKNHGLIVNIYIVYRLTPDTKNYSIALEDCLFGAVKLTKTADIDKYKYSGYGIGFDSRGRFLHPSGDMAEMLLFLELI